LPKDKRVYIDQLNREVILSGTPQRIISLVPSQTEFLADINAPLIGITKFCIHPHHIFSSVARVGGTKKINFKKIAELKPDLIIANKEENEVSQIQELMKIYPVWISDINTLDDALQMMKCLGEITGKKQKALEITGKIIQGFRLLSEQMANTPETSVAYFIWRKPWMVAGSGNFINHILNTLKFRNVFANHSGRYPSINIEELKDRNPELVMLSSEPYPFKQKHIKELQEILPHTRFKLVNGEYFSWYGSRLVDAPEYFLKAITFHDKLFVSSFKNI
jgi:ABC-type Fe3+-hydroxamate transport system substrate-binding protein